MTITTLRAPGEAEIGGLQPIADRVVWLSTAMIHHANRVRPNPGGLKVGGHQASSASTVSIMTTLWFRHLRAQDRISVKPHASPVLHAINCLLGRLDRSYLPRLREFGGLQSHPSRAKDPDPRRPLDRLGPVHRPGTAWLRRLRAGLRDRHRVGAAGGDGTVGPARWKVGLPAAVHAPGRAEPGRGAGRSGRPGTPAPPGRRRRLPAAPRRPAPDHRRRAWRRHAAGAGGGRAAGRDRHRRRRGVPDQPRSVVPGRARPPGAPGRRILDQLFPADRARPPVTVLDGHPHTLSFLATINRVPTTALGVTGFGQSGSLDEVYRHHGLDADSIVRAALDLVG